MGPAEVAPCRNDVGQDAQALFQVPVRIPDHPRVQTHPGHDQEDGVVRPSDVHRAGLTGESQMHGRLGVRREAQVESQQVARTGRQHGERGRGAREGVRRLLHGPVTAGDQHPLHPVGHRLAGEWPGAAVHVRIAHPAGQAYGQRQLLQPRAPGLAVFRARYRVEDDGDPLSVADTLEQLSAAGIRTVDHCLFHSPPASRATDTVIPRPEPF